MVCTLILRRLANPQPVWAAVWLLLLVTNAQGQEPLHVRIDQQIAAASGGFVAPLSNDAEFVRRIYLDLNGRVPTPTEARAFIADPAPNKRAALIDRLLASPQFTRHFANHLDVTFMERRADATVPAVEWQKFLYDSVAANKPLDQLCRELLGADGADANLRAAVKFYLDRQAEPNLLTRDVGRIFFGADIQCAQCHDHPLIDDYRQGDYYGIFAFVSRGVVFVDKKDKDKQYYAEKADGEANYASVFTKVASSTGPRLPGGEPIAEPVFNKGEEYNVAPADGVRPVPKFSRRAQLATLTTNGSHRGFNRNWANRLWAMMLGRGLVEPLDLHHSDNPPAHPQLLEMLTNELVAMKFDPRAYLRQIALSQTYQRSFDMPPSLLEPSQAAAQQVATLEAEMKRLSAIAAESVQALEKAMKERDTLETSSAPLTEELKKVSATIAAAQDAANKAAAALAAAQQQLVAKQDLATSVAGAASKTQEAVKKLPEDKELLAAAEKFVARANQLNGEVAAATKVVTDLTPAATTTAATLTAAQQATAAAQEKVNAARQQIDSLKRQVWALADKTQTENTAATFTTRVVSDTKAVAAFATLVTNVAATRSAAEKSQADFVAAQQSLQQATTQLPVQQAAMVESQKLKDETAKQMAETQAVVVQKTETAKAVADAATQAEVARQKLPNDAELAQAALTVKTRGEQLTAELAELQKVLVVRDQAAKDAAAKFVVAQQLVTTTTATITNLQQQMSTLESLAKTTREKIVTDETVLATARHDITQRWANRFFVSPLRSLTPEQFGWSTLQATGVLESYRAAAEAELNKTAPLDPAAAADPARMAERAKQIEQSVFEKLNPSVAQFVATFGNGAGQPQEFFATVDQALFLANGGTLKSWLVPSGENLTGRLLKLDDPRALADELYTSVLTRSPTEPEIVDITQYLAARPTEKPAVVQELAWALITSAEFRFNH